MHYLKPRATEVKDGVVIQKAFVCDSIKSVDESKRQIDFVISTERVDRMGDIITVAGWQLKEFKNNPVVLFGHASRVPPVGRAIKTWKEQTDVSRALRSTAEFMSADISPFADSIYKMYLGGFLRAVSVGFMPLTWEPMQDEEGRMTGYKFLKQELLEFSCVPIPANPDALLEARSKGIDTIPVKDWAEELLDNWGEEKDPVRLMYGLDRKGLELIRRRAAGAGKTLIIPAHVQDDLLAKNLAAIRESRKIEAVKSIADLPEVEAEECESIVLTTEATDDGDFTFLEAAPEKAVVSRDFVAECAEVDGLTLTIKAKNQTATYLATGRIAGEQETLVIELANLEDTSPTEAETKAAAEAKAAEEAQAVADALAEKAAAEEAAKKAAEEAERKAADEAAKKAAEDAAAADVARRGSGDGTVQASMDEACTELEDILVGFEEVLERTASQGARTTRTKRKMQFLAGYMRQLAQTLSPVTEKSDETLAPGRKADEDGVNGGITSEELDDFLAQKLGPKLQALVQKHVNLLRGRLD